MHYICNANGDITWTAYEAYLDSIRAQLPPHIWAFAVDERHYNLDARQSLHDAWLQECRVVETATGSRQEIRQTEIHLRLLGPWHDRLIHLHYLGVRQYTMIQGDSADWHGDLLLHEVRLNDGLIVHEMVFDHGARIQIACTDLRHTQTMLDSPAP